ncbi:histone deacetylase complex subunit SAP25 isoform X2 [Eublepharis macularius]|uniref:Histone deacetylase complex subunit SAP25 isoform X2 n=1 Tax=Eublepharis macularius TaxID=481883 RepID=A0AA97K5S0_EUBMA|nr:histone deacetylase complex subunit SAP25 isoform X2 [Eublepharis macularius]
MLDVQQELWDMEEEEEEEERSSLEDFSTESEASCCEEFPEHGRGWQGPATCGSSQWRPREHRRCRRRLFAPYDLPEEGFSQDCTGHRRDSRAESNPWGGDSPPWDPPVRSWVRDTEAVCRRSWRLEQARAAAAASSRTLSHPSFQTFFAAVSACSRSCPPSPEGQMLPQPSGGPLPLVDCVSFFYTDPVMPPGYRIYNRLSTSSQEVLRGLRLNTPAPIMCPREASPDPRWLSDLEHKAVSGLLALPAGARSDPSPCPAMGAAGCAGTGASAAPCP